ncbi:MFS transporter [Streptomyces sp. NPDC048659]|uniref:MFS transporter n=1 Tax=Streptomyces sp. NPDC048659 TaxID=3155489 RepID=UPI003447D682
MATGQYEKSATARGGTGPAGGRRARLVLALVCACQFMVILDSSIVNVALPSVRADLGFTDTGVAWVVNGYLLAFAGLLLLGGRAADLAGARRVLTAGLLVFSVSSLVGGLAPTPGVLVAARVAQGVGAALTAPATLAVIHTHFTEPGARARAFGAWASSGGVGGLAGAIVGGAFTTGLSWRWVFLVNVPVGALLVAVALTRLSAARTARREPVDVLGALTGTLGLAALVFGVTGIADGGRGSGAVLGPVLTGAVLLGVFLAVESRASHPMVPLRLFRSRAIATGNAMLLLFGGIAIALWYFTALFLQNVLGFSALQAGLGQTPAAVGFMVVARYASGRLASAGVRALVLAGAACFVAGFLWLSAAGPGSGYATGVLGPTLLVSAGIGLTFPALMAASTAGAPEEYAGTVGGLATTAHQVGGSVGLAVLATAAGARAADAAPGTPAAAAVAAGYQLVFLLAAGLAVAVALISLLVPGRPVRRKPAETP